LVIVRGPPELMLTRLCRLLRRFDQERLHGGVIIW
jgi:hypothetical protein